jgi:hypothetical protein
LNRPERIACDPSDSRRPEVGGRGPFASSGSGVRQRSYFFSGYDHKDRRGLAKGGAALIVRKQLNNDFLRWKPQGVRPELVDSPLLGVVPYEALKIGPPSGDQFWSLK